MPQDLDFKLAAALQLQPRADWAQLAAVLGASENTVARRWARLRDAGMAWVSPAPAPDFHRHHSGAIVLLNCAPEHHDTVARTVAGHAQAVTVDVSAGQYDMQLDVIARDRESLVDYLIGTLDKVPGVVRVQTALVSRLVKEGTRWTLDSLEPAQTRTLNDRRPDEVGEWARRRAPELDELDRELILQLYPDGRESWRELAGHCGVSAQTARRRVERLQARGALALRCHVDDELADDPIGVSLLFSVDPRFLETAARLLGQRRDCRLVAAVAAEFNLFAHLWLPGLDAVERVEIELAKQVPGLRVLNRLVTMRTLKRMGSLLDSAGRRQGHVPLAAWG